ncbi:hypothetical protein [Sphingobacterium suaedae]|uniref:Secreted protein n=1 Tax=Sphingobacterium suaedae TaxID=1686402 RepID=A0ABW5KLL4_9SPHI
MTKGAFFSWTMLSIIVLLLCCHNAQQEMDPSGDTEQPSGRHVEPSEHRIGTPPLMVAHHVADEVRKMGEDTVYRHPQRLRKRKNSPAISTLSKVTPGLTHRSECVE